MLLKYLEFLKKIFYSLSGGQNVVTFSDYLLTIFYTFLILLLITLFIIILYGVFFGPNKLYIKYVYNEKINLWNMIMNQMNKDMTITDDMVKNQIKKCQNLKKMYWVVFVFIYIPFAIPTSFYILDLILSIF